MMRNRMLDFYLFIAANVITFVFITLLQFAKGWRFVLFLLFMHSGIFLFLFVKRRILGYAPGKKKFFSVVYGLLALYIPLLLYKLFSSLHFFDYNEALAGKATFLVTIVALLGCLCNCVWFYRSFRFSGSLSS